MTNELTKRKQISAYFTVEEWKAIRLESAKQKIAMNQWVRNALSRELETLMQQKGES